MEFLPLERYSVDKKKKRSHRGLKRKIETKVNKTSKKSRNSEIKKLRRSKIDIDVENKPVEEILSDEISKQTEEICEDKTNKKAQIHRLFVNMRRVIMSEEEVKEIHPDVISVRFPRKKRSRWCWAVFSSEKKAAKALTELKKRNDIIVTEAHAPSKGIHKKKPKPTNSKLKKSIKSKLLEEWM